MEDKRKLIAATAAVMAYIKTEEEVACSLVAASQPREVPVPAPKLWAVSGRQEQMQLRSLMQLRAFKGAAFR